jgi:hypothetical protein
MANSPDRETARPLTTFLGVEPENQRLKVAFADAGASISKSLAAAAQPLERVFIKALGQVATIINNLTPQFRALFVAASPIVPILAGSLARADHFRDCTADGAKIGLTKRIIGPVPCLCRVHDARVP